MCAKGKCRPQQSRRGILDELPSGNSSHGKPA